MCSKAARGGAKAETGESKTQAFGSQGGGGPKERLPGGSAGVGLTNSGASSWHPSLF